MQDKDWLTHAQEYANVASGCTKVKVGAVITNDDGTVFSVGANKAVPDDCKCSGCLRMKKYGDNSKTHRDPADCRAIHAEVDAIIFAGCNLFGFTIYCTRYPCEACARAIVSAGIKRVVYGRKQPISEITQSIFSSYGIVCDHISDWDDDDVIE